MKLHDYEICIRDDKIRETKWLEGYETLEEAVSEIKGFIREDRKEGLLLEYSVWALDSDNNDEGVEVYTAFTNTDLRYKIYSRCIRTYKSRER